MEITALAPWFGSKRTLAADIVQELGPHSAYWELFCGSMAVLLEKPACPMETVNDLHGDLINLGRVIQDPRLGSALYRRLRRTWCAKAFLDDAARIVSSYANAPAGPEPDMERAYAYFVSCWLGRNGTAGTGSFNQGFCRRFTKNGGSPAKRFASGVESIPAWRVRMRGLTILSECGIGLAERIEDAEGVVIYADPPYLVKGAKYVHDFTPAHHQRLANALSRFKRTRVVVSYYEHPELDRLYPGWTRRRIEVTKAMVNQGQRDKGGAVKAVEVLLINGPSLAKGAKGGLF